MPYQPTYILVTGVAGFIGSHVIAHLATKYPSYNFVGIDKMSYCSTIKNLDPVIHLDNFDFVKCDITHIESVMSLFVKYPIDTILHFAAYSHVDQSFGNSLVFTQNNVMGTHILAEVAHRYSIKRFIHVSTDEVYGNQEHIQSDETSTLDPTNPYAATKAAAENIIRSYYHSFKLPVVITRGNNVYGPRQYPEKVIPRFILNLLNDEKCVVHGTGTQQRSFLFIDDVTHAFDIVLHEGVPGDIINIGCSDEHSILAVARQLITLIKDTNDFGQWITYGSDRTFNDQRYNISTHKLEQLGWRPKVSFTLGLRKTIEWYRNHPDYFDT